MVRRKIKIKLIENATSRQITFSKRRVGLMKKAHDLSVLCDAEVGVIIFSSKGKLFQFASSSMQTVLDRYMKNRRNAGSVDNNGTLENNETDRLALFIEKLKSLQSNVVGEDLEHLSLRDLIHLEQQMHKSLGQIRAKKDELVMEQLDEFKDKVMEARKISNVNANVLEKLVDFCSSDMIGSQNSDENGDYSGCPGEEAPVPFSFRERSNSGHDGTMPTAKRSWIADDLNHTPVSSPI